MMHAQVMLCVHAYNFHVNIQQKIHAEIQAHNFELHIPQIPEHTTTSMGCRWVIKWFCLL